MKFLLPLFIVTGLVYGQTSPVQPSAAPSSAGVASEWDISQTLDAFSAQAKRLKPILDQLTPQEWVSKGAPEAYVPQWRGAGDELAYLVSSVNALKKQPSRLTLALEVYFRAQSLETGIDSLIDGVRKYQNPAIGDLLSSVLGQNAANRERLRQYITDLAANNEQEFQVVDQEAQRCRGILNRQPAPKRNSTND